MTFFFPSKIGQTKDILKGILSLKTLFFFLCFSNFRQIFQKNILFFILIIGWDRRFIKNEEVDMLIGFTVTASTTLASSRLTSFLLRNNSLKSIPSL